MKHFMVIALLLFAGLAEAKTLRIAILDTGLHKGILEKEPKLCKDAHRDFTKQNDPFRDEHGHGTHIAGTIAAMNEKTDYCLIIAKYYHPGAQGDTLQPLIQSIVWAISQKADVINISGGGTLPSLLEEKMLKYALDQKIKVIVAAGNERSDLRLWPYYPACYDKRIIAISNSDKSSNYVGTKSVIYDRCKERNVVTEKHGTVGVMLKNKKIFRMTGTSQSTALFTGRLVQSLGGTK